MNNLIIKTRNIKTRAEKIRNQGRVPGVICGPQIKSEPIEMPENDLRKFLNKPGEVYQVRHGGRALMVKIQNIQKDPLTREILHFSLIQLKKGVRSEFDVPLKITGSPMGLKKGGTLVIFKDHLKVVGKPSMIPENVIGDVTLLDVGDKLTVKDLKIPSRIETSEGNDNIVAMCKGPLKTSPVSEQELLGLAAHI